MRTLSRTIRLLPLLLIAMAAIASSRFPVAFGFGRQERSVDVMSYRGQLNVVFTHGEPHVADVRYARIVPDGIARTMDRWRPTPPTRDYGLLGVHFRVFDYVVQQGQTTTSHQLILPYWLLGLLASTPLMPLVWRWARRRQRLRDGLCTQCGYDLRHSADRCPECGQALPDVPGAAAASAP